ncbi:hypothetical protein HYY69_05765 [Candidatus Woesearchaeota archaeon]|nr:hypothetical protein [Candidatus Woesearchaeota archaeon]
MGFIDDLFAVDTSKPLQEVGDVLGFVIPRDGFRQGALDPKKLLGLPTIPKTAEQILEKVGARRVRMKYQMTKAGVPLVLPYDDTGQLSSLDVVAINKTQERIKDQVMYDYIMGGTTRGNEEVLKGFFEHAHLKATPITLPGGLRFNPSYRTLHERDGRAVGTRNYRVILEKTFDWQPLTITFAVGYEINFRGQIVGFNISYRLHHDYNNYLREFHTEKDSWYMADNESFWERSRESSKARNQPHGEFMIAQELLGKMQSQHLMGYLGSVTSDSYGSLTYSPKYWVYSNGVLLDPQTKSPVKHQKGSTMVTVDADVDATVKALVEVMLSPSSGTVISTGSYVKTRL